MQPPHDLTRQLNKIISISEE
ncbi:hypothetical protein [Photorhabdus sp. P32]